MEYAAGTKLKKVATQGSPVAQSDYVGGVQYENGALAFMQTPDGRVVKNGSAWNYEYYLQDHLGNNRVVFAYTNNTDEYKATMEIASQSTEEAQFKNLPATRVQIAAYNHTSKSYQTPAPDRAAETNGYTNKPVGPSKLLQVRAGDQINAEAYARYATGTSGSTAIISNLVAAVTGAYSIGVGEAAYAGFTNNLPAIAGALTANASVPKAYLIYILFSNNFSSYQFGYQMVSVAAQAGPEKLTTTVTVPVGFDNGYLYIYVANESNVASASSVYFDDLYIKHIKAALALQVTQVTDYYPFGLAINPLGYQKNTSFANKWKFQGQEHIDDLGLNWDSYRYRNHDPAIGRFFNIDPMASAFYYNSPYAFSENKVTTHREMEGLEAFFIHGTISDNSMWKKDVADFIMRELKPYFSTDQTADTGFKWNDYAGGGVNRNWLGNRGNRERATAARQLVAYILKNRKQGQGITLVGHSHGGNVAIQAARILFEKHNTSVNIVNFNTPAWNGANDPENPWDNFGIDEMLHFFTDGDLVAGPLSGESNYGGLVGSNIQQIELKNPLKTNIWGTDQHAFENVNWQEILSRFGASSGGSGEKKKKKQPDADEEACKRSGGCK